MTIFQKTYTRPMPKASKVKTVKGERVAEWHDRKGQRQTAPLSKSGKRIRLRADTYTIRYRDGQGRLREESTGCRDMSAAEAVLADRKRRAELVKANVITAGEDAVSLHAEIPIDVHMEAYLKHLALSASPYHLEQVRYRMERAIRECGLTLLSDMEPDSVVAWLVLLKEAGLGNRTRNLYRATLHAFANWCVKTRRLLYNPIASVPRTNDKLNQRHARRAYTDEEIEKLLFVTRRRPVAEYGRRILKTKPDPGMRKRSNWQRGPLTVENIQEAYARGWKALQANPGCREDLDWAGREREEIYHTLLLTGLRRGELASLKLWQVELDSNPPRIVLEAEKAKNRQGVSIPLHPDLVRRLRSFITERATRMHSNPGKVVPEPPDTVLFDIPRDIYKILNRDLEAAGIEKRDCRGKVVDLHAFRHSFGTNLSRAGVPLRTAQAAMRHSTPELTANVYTDAQLLDVEGAISSLPSLDGDPDSCSAIKKTAS